MSTYLQSGGRLYADRPCTQAAATCTSASPGHGTSVHKHTHISFAPLRSDDHAIPERERGPRKTYVIQEADPGGDGDLLLVSRPGLAVEVDRDADLGLVRLALDRRRPCCHSCVLLKRGYPCGLEKEGRNESLSQIFQRFSYTPNLVCLIWKGRYAPTLVRHIESAYADYETRSGSSNFG